MIYKVEIAPGTEFISRPRCFTSVERYTCPFGWSDSIDNPTPEQAAIAIVAQWKHELPYPYPTVWPVRVSWGEGEAVTLFVKQVQYLRVDKVP